MQFFFWIGFIVLILVLLAIDLGILNRKNHVIGLKEALGWTALWVVVALIFNVALYFIYQSHWLGIGLSPPLSGHEAALQFFTGYLTEKSLSLDNIFVIGVIFAYFKVKAEYQHRVLFWGILGALILRGAMIGAGAALIHQFSWTIYVFGGILLLTAVKMLKSGEDEIEPDKNWLIKLTRRAYPVSSDYDGSKFLTVQNGQRMLTPMFLVLLVVESTDVLFAVDSIPAVFGITQDAFIVFTSNVFAILGLRSLYFALAGLVRQFRYLKVSLFFVLGFVGLKMVLSGLIHISTITSLLVICGMLIIGIGASVLRKRV